MKNKQPEKESQTKQKQNIHKRRKKNNQSSNNERFWDYVSDSETIDFHGHIKKAFQEYKNKYKIVGEISRQSNDYKLEVVLKTNESPTHLIRYLKNTGYVGQLSTYSEDKSGQDKIIVSFCAMAVVYLDQWEQRMNIVKDAFKKKDWVNLFQALQNSYQNITTPSNLESLQKIYEYVKSKAVPSERKNLQKAYQEFRQELNMQREKEDAPSSSLTVDVESTAKNSDSNYQLGIFPNAPVKKIKYIDLVNQKKTLEHNISVVNEEFVNLKKIEESKCRKVLNSILQKDKNIEALKAKKTELMELENSLSNINS